MPSINTEMPTAAEVAAMTAQQRKVVENRLRRAAGRQGMRLEKSRLRDPRAIGYGTFMLSDATTEAVVYAGDAQRGYGLGLADVARYLYEDRDGR